MTHRSACSQIPAHCYDCGLLYGSEAWCDAIVPDEVWRKIGPTGHDGGILCFNCLTRRVVRAGMTNIRLSVNSGPWIVTEAASEAFSRGYQAAIRDRASAAPTTTEGAP